MCGLLVLGRLQRIAMTTLVVYPGCYANSTNMSFLPFLQHVAHESRENAPKQIYPERELESGRNNIIPIVSKHCKRSSKL